MISHKRRERTPCHRGVGGLLLAVFFLLPGFRADLHAEGVFLQRATEEYQHTKAQFAAATNDSPAAWQFARACYDLADFATNDDTRAALAREGIAACRRLIAEQPKSGAAHYYLGMNEGQLARTELMGALFLVRDMEREFKLAWSLDVNVDHGGPARSLGLLYRDTPGWPTSIGSRRKSKEWLERGYRVDPRFPENPTVLCESFLKWRDPKEAAKYFQELVAIWPSAQTNLTGVAWEHDWADWRDRRAAIQAQLKVPDPDAPPAPKPH